MPLYDWVCKRCKQDLAVIRSMSEYETPPSIEEAAGLSASDATSSEELSCVGEHEWERKIGPTTFKLMGYGWYGTGGY